MKAKTKKRLTPQERTLDSLTSVGKATLRDFQLLGVRSVADLARRNPERLYSELCAKKGTLIDPCCLDVFSAAVAQAKNPNLPKEERQWWTYSRLRKAQEAKALKRPERRGLTAR